MRRTGPLPLVAFALGVGLLCGGPPAGAPAFAQSADAPVPTADPPSGGAPSPNAAASLDARAAGTNAGETPLATAEPASDRPRADLQPAEAPPSNAAADPDTQAIRTSGGEKPAAAAAPDADTSQLDLPPSEAAFPNAAADPDAQANGTNDSGMQAEASDPNAEDLQADLPPVGPPSGTAAQLATWVATTGDNDGRPFLIVDKLAANVFVFAPDGSLEGAAPVLVGQTPGDDSAEGVGDRDLSAISLEERTTPAGRFVASFGPASGHRTVLWVDYATAISLHPVITTNRAEHRLERLRSMAAEDRRITFGCINVPKPFYQDVVLKAFGGGSAVVYILPDTKPLQEVFPAFAVVAQTSAPNGAERDPSRPRADPILTLSTAGSPSNDVPEAASGAQDAPESSAPGPVSIDAAANAPAR